MSSNLIYGIQDKPKTIKEWVLYSLQQFLSIITATVMIAQIAGTPVSSALLGAGLGTLVYQLITRFRSPMFISSCGATISAVVGALALPSISGENYLMVAIGGVMILGVYALFALLVKIKGADFLSKIFPVTIIGPITIVIGLNLADFIVGYTHDSNMWEVIVALVTMLVIAISSHYFKGFLKTIPFLLGVAFGYLFALVLTLTGVAPLISFEPFNNLTWYPDLTFLKWNFEDFSWANVGNTALLFIPVACAALLEHYSDHKCLSNMLEVDLTKDPGLDKTLLGDGVASAVGTIVGGMPNTSYGESIATTGFSRVASVWVITAAAGLLGLMSFCGPITAFIQSIPSCVFAGIAILAYGMISLSGLNTLKNSGVDLTNTKNIIIISAILTIGVSGIYLFNQAFSGVSLSMTVGVVLNILLKNKNTIK